MTLFYFAVGLAAAINNSASLSADPHEIPSDYQAGELEDINPRPGRRLTFSNVISEADKMGKTIASGAYDAFSLIARSLGSKNFNMFVANGCALLFLQKFDNGDTDYRLGKCAAYASLGANNPTTMALIFGLIESGMAKKSVSKILAKALDVKTYLNVEVRDKFIAAMKAVALAVGKAALDTGYATASTVYKGHREFLEQANIDEMFLVDY